MNPVNIAFLGCAHVHTQTYIDCISRNHDAKILGIFDKDTAHMQALADQNGLSGFESAQALLEQKPHVAFICTENVRHEEMVIAAAQAGVDVLCEKPLGVTRSSMEAMMAACDTAGVKLMTTFPNRYIHAFLTAKQAVAEGRIGALLGIHATNKGTMPGGWFVQPELSGGGCIIDHTVHVADLVNWMLGEQPMAVQAVCAKRLFDEIDTDDVGYIHFRYPSGVLVTLDSSWSRTRVFPYGRDLTMSLIGSRGVIDIDYFAEHNTVYAANAGKSRWSYFGEDKDQMMIDDLVKAYCTGREFMITGRDGYLSTMVALSAYESAATGREVLIDQLRSGI